MAPGRKGKKGRLSFSQREKKSRDTFPTSAKPVFSLLGMLAIFLAALLAYVYATGKLPRGRATPEQMNEIMYPPNNLHTR